MMMILVMANGDPENDSECQSRQYILLKKSVSNVFEVGKFSSTGLYRSTV
jgi:hypothetical protein